MSRQTDLPFLSHFTKELGACNSFGGGKGENFWEKNPASVTNRRFCFGDKHLRKGVAIFLLTENAAFPRPFSDSETTKVFTPDKYAPRDVLG
jgi:hypothetical protein